MDPPLRLPRIVSVQVISKEKGKYNDDKHSLRNNSEAGSDEPPLDRAQKHDCGTKSIAWPLFSFLASAADVVVILYLAYTHFVHSHDILGWLMLLPILLNFIGIFAFLSNEVERKEFETLGGQKLWKHFMVFPVIGPTISSLRLFVYALQEKNSEKFERLESLLTKMKQYESFFRAAPEALVQITFQVVSWQTMAFMSIDVWSSVCIALSIFALAESNIYAPILPAYYRLFNYTEEKGAWRVEDVSVPWRAALFTFNFLSFASRLFADAVFRATACFYFMDYAEGIDYAEVIAISFVLHFLGRGVLHAVGQIVGNCFEKPSTFSPPVWEAPAQANGKPPRTKRTRKYVPVQEDMTGVYGAFTYSWRALFMSFDFQHWKSNLVFLWFFIENCLLLGWSLLIINLIEYDLPNKGVYYAYVSLACVSMVIAICLKYVLLRYWRRQQERRASIFPEI